MNHPRLIALVLAGLTPLAIAGPANPPVPPTPTLRTVDGKKQGLEVKFHDNGNLRETINWSDGKRHGPFRSYHKNSALDTECEYANGLREGVRKSYNDNGEIVWEVPYVNDKVHGLKKQWYNDWDDKNNPQPLFATTQFEEGVEHGEHVEYWADAKRHIQGQFKLGQRDGVWHFYRTDGRPLKSVIYDKGRKVSETNSG